MSQIVGTPNLNYGGIHLGQGSGPCAIFFGALDPTATTDTSLDRVTLTNASPGSLFLRTDTGALYVKSASNVWQQVTVP
jgi:hypothetical protein